ncbi:CehA/McbA family metallohydrolase [bacterium]|nr:CehA/McbA family metallohydrolase [bacterium]
MLLATPTFGRFCFRSELFKKILPLLICVLTPLAIAQRVCETPDSLFVDSSVQRSLNLYIYVPFSTSSYTIQIYDQNDDEGTAAQPSSFVLYYPDGSVAQTLDNPLPADWSTYQINSEGHPGIWRLSISGPKPSLQGEKAPCNYFLVRTIGDVDLYLKPEPRARLWFSPSHFGKAVIHNLYIQVPLLKRFRINMLRPTDANIVKFQLEAPKGVKFSEKWGGLPRGNPEFVEIKGNNLKGIWVLRINEVKANYAIGMEQELRIFFNDSPLMRTEDVLIKTVADDGRTPLPARIDITSPLTKLESYVVYTDSNGSTYLSLLPEGIYTITVSRGLEYEPYTFLTTSQEKSIVAPLRRILNRKKGWYCGDTHMHTIYSDGNDTPYQMVEAGKGEGLDWIVLTDHGSGENIPYVLTAHKEAMPFSEPGKFVIIPGEEFTVSRYHANIINGTVKAPSTSTLSQVVQRVRSTYTLNKPITIKLNHPYWGGTPEAPEVARETPLLPMMELWNDDPPNEPRSAYLLWELLNSGQKIFADTATDTHNRKTSKVGARRTYVYIGDAPLTANNVTLALMQGHSFISRGALVFFQVEGKIPGEEVAMSPNGNFRINIEVESIFPLDRVELVSNGKVLHTLPVNGSKRLSINLLLPLPEGWVIAQAVEKDTVFPLAMTNPIFIKKQ